MKWKRELPPLSSEITTCIWMRKTKAMSTEQHIIGLENIMNSGKFMEEFTGGVHVTIYVPNLFEFLSDLSQCWPTDDMGFIHALYYEYDLVNEDKKSDKNVYELLAYLILKSGKKI